MSELDLDGRYAARVRIEITTNDGITYEVELKNCDKSELRMEPDVTEVPSDTMSLAMVGTGSAEVRLTAHGRIVKAERRQTT